MKIKQSWIWPVVGAMCSSLSAQADLTTVNTGGSWDGNPPGTLYTVMQSLIGNSGYNVNAAVNRVDDSSDQIWTAANGTGASTMLLTIAGFRGVNSFGIFNLSNPSQTLQIFGGGTSPTTSQSIGFDNGTVTVNGNSLHVGTDFGFYLNTPNNTWYSVQGLNTYEGDDGGDQMVTLKTSTSQLLNLSAPNLAGWGSPGGTVAWNLGSFILGWEDLPVNGSDKGDVDYQDMVLEISGVTPVPEPTTVLAGAMLLLPFGIQTLRIFRKRLMA